MSIRVLHADDHAMFRQGLVPLLEAEPGLELLAQAADGREAWEGIQTLVPDIAVLDLGMPGMSGIEVTRRILAAGLRTRSIILTMHDDLAAPLEARNAGACGYVLKDNSFEELVIAVRTVAAGGTFLTSLIQRKLDAQRRNGAANAALSARERQVLTLIASGHSSKEIARRLDISHRTVDTYRKRLMDKLGLKSLADVVRYAVGSGMVS